MSLPLVGAGPSAASMYDDKVLSYNPDAFWPLADSVGSALADDIVGAHDILYSASGVTLGVDGIGDGLTAAEFDGNNSYVHLGSLAQGNFDDIWDGDYGSATAWGRVDGAARWTDGATRWMYHVRKPSDSTYYVCFGKQTPNHQIEWRRRSGGLITSVQYTFAPTGTLDWFAMGMTWNIDVPEIRCFVNGALAGSNGAGMTAFGAQSVENGTSVLYAGSLTLQEWIGRGGRIAHWQSVLSDDAMIDLTQL